MSRAKNPFILTSIGIILGLGILSASAQAQLLSWIDHAFILGIGWLVVSAALFVIRGGFFHLFASSFKNFNQWLFSPGAAWANHEQERLADQSQTNAWLPLLITSSLMVGLFFILLSLVLLYVR
ncbi:DUF3899 domain-containing protein [Laceyella putida]|jgi:hypothetical protein|uniref:DUF3899 domain-containing protein n=1 Tax=Laceyella putida TaxID=110101 RepID=A0ABW2RFE3_9BACL